MTYTAAGVYPQRLVFESDSCSLVRVRFISI